MISNATFSTWIVSHLCSILPDDGSASAVQRVLTTLDHALEGAAVTLAVGGGVWWAVRSRRDPLAWAPRRPNRFREDVIALAILAYLLAAVAISGIVRAFGGDPEGVPVSVAVGGGAQIAGFVVCLVLAANRFGGGVGRFCWGKAPPGRGRPAVTTLAMTLLALGLCPILFDASMTVVEHVVPGYEFDPHPTIKALHGEPQPPGVVALLWIGAALVAPAAEEAFFRGLLQTLLTNLFRSRWIAIGAASLAFGTVHFGQAHAIPALVLLSVLLGYAYERTGSLMAPFAIHAAFNLKTLVWDALGGSLA